MVCEKCGKTIRNDSVFCTYCGSKIEQAEGGQVRQGEAAQGGFAQDSAPVNGQPGAQTGYGQGQPQQGYMQPGMGMPAASFTYVQGPSGYENANQYDREKVMSAQESSWNANIAAAADRARDRLTAADLQQIELDAQLDSAPANEVSTGIHPVSVIFYLLAAAYLGLEIYSIITSGNLGVMAIIEYLFLNLLIPAGLFAIGVIIQLLADIRSYADAASDKKLTVGKLQIKRKQ